MWAVRTVRVGLCDAGAPGLFHAEKFISYRWNKPQSAGVSLVTRFEVLIVADLEAAGP